MDCEQTYETYKSRIDRYLGSLIREARPRSLYEPMKYVLAGGGKRIRPVLVLLACEAVGGRTDDAIHAAAAMEILHNFTLVHDDIMDHARSRRGRDTVHTKWDTNVAILCGDALLALAYRTLLKTRSPRIQEISTIFTQGVLDVCEGQAYDKEFEERSRVGVEEYMQMIQKKTAAMVAVAVQLGALIGNASVGQREALRKYGKFVGTAFQIQDDLLDIVGDEKKFGKTIGGDLVEGKKTFLLLEALRHAQGRDRQMLLSVMRHGRVPRTAIKQFKRIYVETGAIQAAREQIAANLRRARTQVRNLPESAARRMLLWFTEMLLNRTY